MKIVDHQRKKKLFYYGCDSHLLTKEYLVSNGMVIEDWYLNRMSMILFC